MSQKAEVSSCDRGHVAYKAWDVYYPAFHRKSLPIWCRSSYLLLKTLQRLSTVSREKSTTSKRAHRLFLVDAWHTETCHGTWPLTASSPARQSLSRHCLLFTLPKASSSHPWGAQHTALSPGRPRPLLLPCASHPTAWPAPALMTVL